MSAISPSLSLRVRGHMFDKVLRDHNLIIKETQLMIEKSANASNKNSKKSTLLMSASIEGPAKNDAQKRASMLLDTIVVTLGASLNLPDEEVVKQDDF